VNQSDDFFLFISDGIAGAGNDTVIQLVGLNDINGIDLVALNLLLLS
jgi:hypothetical protein